MCVRVCVCVFGVWGIACGVECVGGVGRGRWGGRGLQWGVGVDGVGLRGRGLEAGEAGSAETGIDKAGGGEIVRLVFQECAVWPGMNG